MGVQILRYYFEVFGPGVQILRSSWTPWGSSYFRGGPNTSALLWSNWTGGPNTSKYLDRGGPISGGSIFFVTDLCIYVDRSTATVSGIVASCDGPQLAQARSDRLVLPRALLIRWWKHFVHCLYFVGRCVVEEANIKDAPNFNCLPVFY